MRKKKFNFVKLIVSLIVVIIVLTGIAGASLYFGYKNHLKNYTMGNEITFKEYYSLVLKERKK